MPSGDGRGPLGLGPRSGRAAGFCAGFNTPGYANFIPGKEFGKNAGSGRGCGRKDGFGALKRNYALFEANHYPPLQPEPESEKLVLKQKAEYHQRELESINQKLDEMETRSSKN